MTTEELNVIITAQNKEFNKRLDEVNGQLDTLGKKAETSAQSTSNAFRSMAAVLSSLGIAKLLGDMNKAYTVQMLNETKLETVMRNRIGATEEEIASVKRLTAAQQQIGIIGDEIQLAGAQQLATFATSAKTIETLIPAMNNLMAQQNGFNSTESSAVSVANLMGKALNGQASALTRVGITFSKAQEQVLKYGTEAQRAATLAEVITQNVGNMNEALRNTTQGELQALKNDFGDLKEEIGATFQPLLGVLIPMVSDGLQTVRPYVEKLGEGFKTVADYISALSPETKKLITQGVMGVAVIAAVTKGMKLLSLATRSASGWLGVIVTALALLTAYRQIENAGDSTANSLDKEEESANNAAAGISNLNDSVGELGDTTKKSLAAVDKLNIINGSTGGIIDVDTESISAAADEAAALKKDLEEATGDNLEIGVDLSWEGIMKSFSALWDWLTTDGWAALKDTVGWLVGNAWEALEEAWNTTVDIGKNIWKFFFGTEAEKDEAAIFLYDTLGEINEKFKTFFGDVGEDWSAFWTGIGDGIFELANGDMRKGLDLIDRQFRETFGDIWVDVSNYMQDIGSAWYEMLHGDEIKMNELASKYNTLNSDMNAAIVENLKQGQSAEEALETAKAKLLTTSEMVYYYNNGGIAKTLSDVQRWQNNLIESGQLYDYADYSDLSPAFKPDYSGKEQQSISGLRSLRDTNTSEGRIPPISLTVVSELDGEKVGEFSRNYSARDLARSNGY